MVRRVTAGEVEGQCTRVCGMLDFLFNTQFPPDGVAVSSVHNTGVGGKLGSA